MVAGRSANLLLLEAQLRRGEALPLARRAERLPMAGGPLDRVVEAELGQDGTDVVDVAPRREPLAAAGAVGTGVGVPRLVVELDPELRRPLEDVEQLAEGEIQQ